VAKKNDPEQLGLSLRSTAAPKRLRLGNASVPDVRKFYQALADEKATSWTDSNGTVRKLNRRGTAAQTFASSTEILSQKSSAAKAKLTRQRTAERNTAIRNNANKSAFGETKRQRASAGQERLINLPEETDSEIQQRIRNGIKKAGGGLGVFVTGINGGNIGTGLDELYASNMANSAGRGSGGGRMIGRPRKAL
jgi:hypothetical protein